MYLYKFPYTHTLIKQTLINNLQYIKSLSFTQLSISGLLANNAHCMSKLQHITISCKL